MHIAGRTPKTRSRYCSESQRWFFYSIGFALTSTPLSSLLLSSLPYLLILSLPSSLHVTCYRIRCSLCHPWRTALAAQALRIATVTHVYHCLIRARFAPCTRDSRARNTVRVHDAHGTRHTWAQCWAHGARWVKESRLYRLRFPCGVILCACLSCVIRLLPRVRKLPIVACDSLSCARACYAHAKRSLPRVRTHRQPSQRWESSD